MGISSHWGVIGKGFAGQSGASSDPTVGWETLWEQRDAMAHKHESPPLQNFMGTAFHNTKYKILEK